MNQYHNQGFSIDPYKILGVSYGALDTEIKAAYRTLAKTYHPDRNPTPEAEETFRVINEAYQILNDPIKKNRFDAEREKRLWNPKGFVPDDHHAELFSHLKEAAKFVANQFFQDDNDDDEPEPLNLPLAIEDEISTSARHSSNTGLAVRLKITNKGLAAIKKKMKKNPSFKAEVLDYLAELMYERFDDYF